MIIDAVFKAKILAAVTKVNALKESKKKVFNPKTEQLATLIDVSQFEKRFDLAIRKLFEAALSEPVRPGINRREGDLYRLGGMYVCTSDANGHDYGDEPFIVVRSVATHSEVRGLKLRASGALDFGNTPHPTSFRKATKVEIKDFLDGARTAHVEYEKLLNDMLVRA